MKKEYYCCICHKEIKRNNRLLHQIFDSKKTYGRFNNNEIYDYCDRCFKIFEKWIKKHNGER